MEEPACPGCRKLEAELQKLREEVRRLTALVGRHGPQSGTFSESGGVLVHLTGPAHAVAPDSTVSPPPAAQSPTMYAR